MQIKMWWPITFVVLIVIASIMVFPSDLRLADLLGKSGKTDEAIEAYEILLAEKPQRTDIRIQLAKLYIQSADFPKTINELEKIGTDLINDPALLNQLADIYSQMGNRKKTVDVLERIITILPEDLEYQYKLSDAYEWAGENEKSMRLYGRLLANDPQNTELLNKLVELNLNAGNFPRVKTYLTRLLTIEPRNTTARVLLGDIYIELGQREFAAVEYERVLNLNPDNETLRFKLAELYIWNQSNDRAIAHFEQLVLDDVDNKTYFDKIISLTENYDPEKAVKFYRYRLKFAGNDLQTRKRLMGQYIKMGYTDEAIDQLKIMVKQDPDNLDHQKELAYLYENILEPDLAAATFEDIIRKKHLDKEIFDELQLYYQENKQYDELLALYADYYSDNQLEHAELRDYAGLLNYVGEYEAAQHQYESVLRTAPEDAESRLALIWLYQKNDQNQDALITLKDGVEKYSPADEEFLLYAAQFYDSEKLYKESIPIYQRLADLHSDNVFYEQQLLTTFLADHNYAATGNILLDMVEKDPRNLNLKIEYADLLWLRGDFDEMHNYITKTRSEHRAERNLDRRIGTFLFEKGFYEDAILAFEQQVQFTPEDSVSMQLLSLAYAWNSQPEKATNAFKEYHEIYPDDYFTRYHHGVLLALIGKKTAARREIQTAETLLKKRPADRQSRVVQANIYAFLGERNKAIAAFEQIATEAPNDLQVKLDYSEGMLALREYDKTHQLIDEVLEREPHNYRALRLQGRAYYEQEGYAIAAESFSKLHFLYPNDINLAVDLAETELAAGDWVASQNTFQGILDINPDYFPAHDRLNQLRRDNSQAIVADYQRTTQSGNFIRQAANVILTKAKSSFLAFKLFMGEEKYMTDDNSLSGEDLLNFGAGILSSFNSKIQTFFSGKAQEQDDEWKLAGNAWLKWRLNSSASFQFSSDINDVWNDPLIAAFYAGRVNRFQTDANIALLGNVLLWGRFSYEKHQIMDDEPFGVARRSYGQASYQWLQKPALATYYQFYNLKYDYEDTNNQAFFGLPEAETIHYAGLSLNQQLTRRLYYQFAGGIGKSFINNSNVYYGQLNLEYMLFNNLSLRSLVEMGTQNTLASTDDNKTIRFDFHYFY